MLQAIPKTKLYEEVSQQIIKMIVDGNWLPGEKIPTENSLAETFCVSRSTVREALKSLQISKILTSKTGMGTYVSDDAKDVISSRELISRMGDEEYFGDLIDVRFILEPQLASLASENRNEKDLEKLYGAINKMNYCKTKEELVSAGFMFHNIIADICPNRILKEFYNSISSRLLKMRSLDFLTKEVYERDINEHLAIADAIKDKNGELASNLMKKHLADDYKNYIK